MPESHLKSSADVRRRRVATATPNLREVIPPATPPLWSVDGAPARPALDGPHEADVVIVGAGFTGLWTAAALTEQAPELRVVIVEAETVGFGASGRNGGWCSAIAPMDLTTRATDPDGSRRFQAELDATVAAVGRWTETHGVACGFRQGGWLHVARTEPQRARLLAELDTARAAGLAGDDDWLDATATTRRVAVAGALGARFSPHCAALDPGRLVRGLATVCEQQGVTIFERSPVIGLEPGCVRTTSGTVVARSVVRATEAYTARLPGEKRTMVPIYSLMIATEPLGDEVWQQLGWQGRETLNDARRLVIYAQRTEDGRIAFGGRGAPYHWGSTIDPRFDHDDAVHRRLVATLHELFPAVAGRAITHRWGGPLGVPRDWHPSVGYDRRTGMGWAGGYVGDGVASSHLAGRTLAALVLGSDDPLTRLPWVGHHSPRWEPEPLRWAAIRSALLLTRSIDASEARSGRPAGWRSAVLDRLTGG